MANYNYLDFFRIPGPNDTKISIKDINGNITWSLSPFKIETTVAINNNVKILFQNGDSILIDFNNSEEAQTANGNILNYINILRNKTPSSIDKGTQLYIDNLVGTTPGLTGPQGPIGPQGSFGGPQGDIGPQGILGPQGDKSGIQYKFDSSTEEGIGTTGSLRFNSSDITDVTYFYINIYDRYSYNFGEFISLWSNPITPIRGYLSIKESNYSTYSSIFAVTGEVIPHVNYYIVPVTYILGNLPSNNGNISIDYAGSGRDGVQGHIGVQGFQGIEGVQGFQGPLGFQGFQGNIGVQGFQGIDGVQGFQGTQGLIGNQGFQGIKGNTGSIGPQGPIGIQGSTGSIGIQGADGPIGYQGIQGPFGLQGFIGSIGPVGNQGFQGPTGSKGDQGDSGTDGATGLQGPRGNQGNQGTQGPIGVQGVTGSIGLQGPTGPQGTQGEQGFQGPSVGYIYNKTIFVDTNGDDNNATIGDIFHPYANVSNVLTYLNDNSLVGYTIVVYPGDYNDNNTWIISPSNKVTIKLIGNVNIHTNLIQVFNKSSLSIIGDSSNNSILNSYLYTSIDMIGDECVLTINNLYLEATDYNISFDGKYPIVNTNNCLILSHISSNLIDKSSGGGYNITIRDGYLQTGGFTNSISTFIPNILFTYLSTSINNLQIKNSTLYAAGASVSTNKGHIQTNSNLSTSYWLTLSSLKFYTPATGSYMWYDVSTSSNTSNYEIISPLIGNKGTMSSSGASLKPITLLNGALPIMIGNINNPSNFGI